MRSIHEVETAAKIGQEYKGLTPNDTKRFSFDLGENYCRDCGLCLPCPEKINIPAILRFHTFYDTYCLKEWAKKLYSGLDIKADKCTHCGDYESKCPYEVSILDELKEVQQDLK